MKKIKITQMSKEQDSVINENYPKNSVEIFPNYVDRPNNLNEIFIFLIFHILFYSFHFCFFSFLCLLISQKLFFFNKDPYGFLDVFSTFTS